MKKTNITINIQPIESLPSSAIIPEKYNISLSYNWDHAMKNIGIFCGSNLGNSHHYKTQTIALANELYDRDITLIMVVQALV